MDGRGRKPKKGKAKANDYEPSTGSKRKRGIKSLSVTPDGDDDDDDHETVSNIKGSDQNTIDWFFAETTKDQNCLEYWTGFTACCAGQDEEGFHGVPQSSLSLRG